MYAPASTSSSGAGVGVGHALTQEEREAFNRDGYLVVPEVLSPQEIQSMVAATDEIHAREVARVRRGEVDMKNPPADLTPTIWRGTRSDPTTDPLFYTMYIQDHPEAFLPLIDHPRVFPKVWGLMGFNIYCFHTHLIVTPPANRPRRGEPGQTGPDFSIENWHQDSGRVNQDLESGLGVPRPRLSVKVAYFLSDTREEGVGNFWVLPGSHRTDPPLPFAGQPVGAVPVRVPPGTAVIFDRRLVHAASVNYSGMPGEPEARTRKAAFVGYGFRLLRTKDAAMGVHNSGLWDHPLVREDAVRLQLLDCDRSEVVGGKASARFMPVAVNTPLAARLQDLGVTVPGEPDVDFLKAGFLTYHRMAKDRAAQDVTITGNTRARL